MLNICQCICIPGRIYWSDRAEHKICSSNLDGTDLKVVVDVGVHSAYGLAIDSTGRKIYWTDAIRQRIEVANLDEPAVHRKVLISYHLDSPRALVLHYHAGMMFWADWGNEPRIERADMDGGNRKVLVEDNLGWPNGLTIDRPNNQLYWADAKTKVTGCSISSLHFV